MNGIGLLIALAVGFCLGYACRSYRIKVYKTINGKRVPLFRKANQKDVA